MPQPVRVLIIEDSENDAFFMKKQLEKHGYAVEWERVQTGDAMRACLQDKVWDVILSDHKMPKFSGMEALEILTGLSMDIPFIIVSGTIGEELAVAAMKAGACDYILKDNLQRLGPAVEREIKEACNRGEKRKAEEALRLYMRRLEQSNKELEQFALVASHDLQEPLRKIRMFAEFLKKADGDRLSEEGQNYLCRMDNAVERMHDLIADLLDLSRINRKGQPFKQVRLSEVISIVLSDLQFALSDTQGRVEMDELCTIEADPRQMEQLFLNLIGNSLKFHRKDVPPVVNISTAIRDDFCEICVEDNGIGFDEQYQDRIFKVFERLHGRGKYEGTGIGLAICKKIADRHGGTIIAEGKPNEGATFRVRLPATQSVRQPLPGSETVGA